MTEAPTVEVEIIEDAVDANPADNKPRYLTVAQTTTIALIVREFAQKELDNDCVKDFADRLSLAVANKQPFIALIPRNSTPPMIELACRLYLQTFSKKQQNAWLRAKWGLFRQHGFTKWQAGVTIELIQYLFDHGLSHPLMIESELSDLLWLFQWPRPLENVLRNSIVPTDGIPGDLMEKIMRATYDPKGIWYKTVQIVQASCEQIHGRPMFHAAYMEAVVKDS